MDYRFLGKTGLRVSELCLGAMTFGRESSEQDSYAMMDRFIEAGGNFIDTMSTARRSRRSGRWLKQRDDIVPATKVPFYMTAQMASASAAHILSSVEASLRRLQTDYIDLYQVHAWDPVTPLGETLSTLDGLVQAGKVRYLGVSNFTGWQLQKAVDRSRRRGWEPFVSLQPL